MKKRTFKSLPEYENNIYEEDKILKSKKIRRKMPTSISLSPDVVKELKQLAETFKENIK